MFNFTNWILGIQSAILLLETGSAGILVGVAQSAVTAMGIVLICMFGLRAAQSIEHGQPAAVGGIVVIALKLGLCFAVLGAWTIPAPGLGAPIGTWIPNEGLKLARFITWDGAQTVATSLASWGGMESPGGAFISIGTIYWICAQVFLLVASLMLAVVIVGPQVIVTGMIIIGPIFVPMWPIPELTAYARGYVRALVTYSLVPPLAAIVLLVIGSLLSKLNTGFGIATSVEDYLPRVLGLCVVLFISLWAMVKVVKTASEIMTGSAGSGLGWIAGGAAAVKTLF